MADLVIHFLSYTNLEYVVQWKLSHFRLNYHITEFLSIPTGRISAFLITLMNVSEHYTLNLNYNSTTRQTRKPLKQEECFFWIPPISKYMHFGTFESSLKQHLQENLNYYSFKIS